MHKGPSLYLQILQVSTFWMLAILILTKFIRDEYNKNPELFPKAIQWEYSMTSGTGGLRTHIKNHHLELYKQLCAEHNIRPSPGVVGKSATAEETTPVPGHEPFNSDTLLRYIWNFVVTNNQVSL